MKLLLATGTSHPRLCPESAAEAGLLFFLAERYKDRPLALTFDTTTHEGKHFIPMLWLVPVPTEADP